MARIARVIAEAYPHHITQCGNSPQRTLFGVGDCRAYPALMAEWCKRHQVDILAYYLTPNHVHPVAVPQGPPYRIGGSNRISPTQVIGPKPFFPPLPPTLTG